MTFGSRTVLSDFGVDLRGGQVHALLGQNGSGKSTFIKILTGYHRPDDGGRLEVRGDPVGLPLQPGQPKELGLAFVHQELGLVPSLSILENLRVGRYETRRGWRIPWARERSYVRERLRRFGVDADPEASVESLVEADRAIVAIVRALEELSHVDQGLLVLDEPTVYLPRDAARQLFGTVREVTAAGHAVLVVTHRLEEVFQLADRVTVLRDGHHVVTTDVADVDEPTLVDHILGRSLDSLYPDADHARGDVVLKASGVRGEKLVDVGFELRRGEILGVTGLAGMGSEELPYLLVGAGNAAGGELEAGGDRLDLTRLRPGVAFRHGVALLPADRSRQGGVGEATVLENLTLSTLGRFFRNGRLHHRSERRHGAELLERFDVRPPAGGARFATLSGGNQQKVVLAKWFETGPAVFILHEPTQGVDIGARQQIFAELEQASAAGTAFIISSVEYEDLAHLCDRVLVVREGRVVAQLGRGELSASRIVEQCYTGVAEAGSRRVPGPVPRGAND
jgi:ribose transport system ATP-binding protein